jgi:hypothetical protein
MRFFAQAGPLLRELRPAIVVAQNGEDRDCLLAGCFTLIVRENRLVAAANDGYIALETMVCEIGGLTEDGAINVKVTDLLSSVRAFRAHAQLELSTKLQEGEHEFLIESVGTGEFQAPPCIPSLAVAPSLEEQSYKPIVVMNRRDLLRATELQKAVGRDQDREEFLYWALRVWPNHVRLTAGNGGRFLIWEKQGTQFLSTQEEQSLLFLGTQTSPWLKALSYATADELQVHRSATGSLRMKTGAVTIDFLDSHEPKSWGNEGKLLDHDCAFRCTVALNQFRQITGLFKSEDNKGRLVSLPEPVLLQFDLKQRSVRLRAQGRSAFARKILVCDAVAGPMPISSTSFQVQAASLLDLVKFAEKNDEYVQLELIDGEAPVLLARYGAGEQVQDSVWHRDFEDMTRERRIIFFRLNNVLPNNSTAFSEAGV